MSTSHASGILLGLLILACGGAGPATTQRSRVPTAQQVVDLLERVRDRLEAGTGCQFIDSQTRQPIIPEREKPGVNVTLDPGPERKFTPYSYPMGVVYSGMMSAADATGDARFNEFVKRRFKFFGQSYPTLSSWPAKDVRRNPFRGMLAPAMLDDCGSMGAAMIKARRANLGPDLKEVIDRFADYISTKQYRLDDGTLARPHPFPNSIWLDDAYMSVPFLAQMGKLTGETKYFDDACRQIKQFYAHLFVPEKSLFAHALNVDAADQQPRWCWGRANGWVMLATVELLDVLPADHPQRNEILTILRAHARGVASVQAGDGMWHQLLDRADSFEETSCTAMFTYAMARGVNNGWLDAGSYGPPAILGFTALLDHVSSDGRLDSVCAGTGFAEDPKYYYHRPAVDDVHGYGPVLLAGSEIIRMLKNDQLKINASDTAPVMVRKR